MFNVVKLEQITTCVWVNGLKENGRYDFDVLDQIQYYINYIFHLSLSIQNTEHQGIKVNVIIPIGNSRSYSCLLYVLLLFGFGQFEIRTYLTICPLICTRIVSDEQREYDLSNPNCAYKSF